MSAIQDKNPQPERVVRVGLVGYGRGGQLFHAPYIRAARGIELAGVVTRNADRRAQAEADNPGVPVYASLAEMVEAEGAGAGIDAVTITTPPTTRRELVLEALELGVDVDADKPFAPSARAALELGAAAEARGRILSVFHNRRWDTDIRTVRAVIEAGGVGRPAQFFSHFDLDEPGGLEGGPGGGLLRDLGTHLADQALWLFGPVASVHARLETSDTPEGSTDAAFTMTLVHAGGVETFLSASKLHRLNRREMAVLGSEGSFRTHGPDVQTQALARGERPEGRRAVWGYAAPEDWGVLSNASGIERVPSAQGDYCRYYEDFARAVRARAAPPVTVAQAAAVLAVLDAARESAAQGQVVEL